MWTRWPNVDLAPTPAAWRLPANLLPAQGPQSWPRGRRSHMEATDILATAEAWWDVDRSGFRDGDRFLRNIGTAGGALDLRLGSSVNANSNDPLYLAPQDTGYAYLPGLASNYLSVPDENALDITGDIDIRVRCIFESVTPSMDLVNKWVGSNSYALTIVSGVLRLYWFDTASRNASATVTIPTPNTTPLWYRATLDVDNGASGRDITFYTSQDGTTWTQLGSTVTQATVTSIAAGTSLVYVGIVNLVGAGLGRFHRAQVLNGINGTTVLDVDCDAITSGSATSFTATTGQTVTINRATSGRKTVAVPSRAKGGRPLMLLGTDDYLECRDAAQHGLLNFGQGDSFTVLGVVRRTGTLNNFNTLMAKKAGVGTDTTAGYGMRLNADGKCYVYTADGLTQNSAPGGPTATAGNLGAYIFTSTVQANASWLANAFTSLPRTVASAWTIQTLRVGRAAITTDYADMEFLAAAIWRRALTSREITVINNAAPWGT